MIRTRMRACHDILYAAARQALTRQRRRCLYAMLPPVAMPCFRYTLMRYMLMLLRRLPALFSPPAMRYGCYEFSAMIFYDGYDALRHA